MPSFHFYAEHKKGARKIVWIFYVYWFLFLLAGFLYTRFVHKDRAQASPSVKTESLRPGSDAVR